MKTTTRKSSPTMSQNSNNSLWNGVSSFPCLHQAAAPSFIVGSLPYRYYRPDSC
ncbi:hypothetical protein JY651_30905 [Pyxidicoccus parkwayensis]|uniref:Uncharacterized protein n=1 Tax=Pyxidicoccus parkwayensis TaxID=2813578 RepID=A0ABX7NQ52_9BACT|nr:hypothetical protein [Pyxidicoccus parkwaysis]QSQ19705.1 hypothetical protein JY651_30905 [Pyxidicoccus parkwaysis]